MAAGLAGVGSKEHPVQALVDIDSGIHRGGRQPGEDALRFALELKSFEGLAIKGAFTYNGAIYQSASRTEMEANAEAEARILTETANLLRTNGIPVCPEHGLNIGERTRAVRGSQKVKNLEVKFSW